jgi:hypothetical protein
MTLQRCGIGPDVGPLLSELVQLPKLKILHLTSNLINNATVTALADVKVKRKLLVGLGYNSISDRGAEALLNGAFLRSSKVRVVLDGNRITRGMKTRMQQAFGNRVLF